LGYIVIHIVVARGYFNIYNATCRLKHPGPTCHSGSGGFCQCTVLLCTCGFHLFVKKRIACFVNCLEANIVFKLSAQPNSNI